MESEALKWCAGCEQPKDPQLFGKNRSTADGRQYKCKECRSTAGKKRYITHKAEIRATNDRWRAANPERARQITTDWMAARPEYLRIYAKENSRRLLSAYLQRRYGITIDDYESMLSAQGGVCAICGTDEPGGRGKRFHVDHNHQTKAVRGLLCHGCNTALGGFQEKVAVLQKAIEYLQK